MADLVRGGFVESITRTILPSLSEKALETDQTAFRQTIVFGLRLSAFVTLPATVLLAILASPVIDLAFRRGRFVAADVEGTTLALAGYAVGLFAIGAVKILTQAFYALHDTRTPVVVATFDLIAFVILCLVLSRSMKHVGVALATSAGFWINFILLFILLARRVPGLFGKELILSSLRLLLASGITGLGILAGTLWLLPYAAVWALPLRAIWLLSASLAAAGLYLAVARLLGAPEVGEVLGVFRRKRARA
jgi:putative peptidoglycan lipid II flippase